MPYGHTAVQGGSGSQWRAAEELYFDAAASIF